MYEIVYLFSMEGDTCVIIRLVVRVVVNYFLFCAKEMCWML